MYLPKPLKVIETPDKGLAVIAREKIGAGEVVCELFFDSLLSSAQTSGFAIQRWEDCFLNNSRDTIDNYFNHGCDPTTKINFSRYTFEAIRDIKRGEEITWNYLTTEYELDDFHQFDCRCGSKACYGQIRGFKYLTLEQQEKLLPYLSTFLKLKRGNLYAILPSQIDFL